jgi:hypothetical protein
MLDARCTGPDAVHFDDVKDGGALGPAAAHFDPRRRGVYRYAIFAHFNTAATGAGLASGHCDGADLQFGSTGLARTLPGRDLIVSLGYTLFDLTVPPQLTPVMEAGAFMHELGHLLNLRHGGNSDEPIAKPNIVSVMNYSYMFGIYTADAIGATSCPLGCPSRVDYSNEKLPTLDENSLDEAAGVGASQDDIIEYTDTACNFLEGAGRGPIDWNGDGAITPGRTTSDIDDFYCLGSPGETLTGFREWPGDACTIDDDCPSCVAPGFACPNLSSGHAIPVAQLPPTCPIGASGACHQPCVAGHCVPMELAFQCR